MAKRYDISTPRPGKDGKTFWHRIGTAWEGDKGIQLVFDSLPLPDKEGRCVANLFEPREPQARSASRDQANAREHGGRQASYADDESIPF
jgi:hypothetical protein